jgi:AraC-like DNA-binding protein/quercetin dioxygenase-like cupin family protein
VTGSKWLRASLGGSQSPVLREWGLILRKTDIAVGHSRLIMPFDRRQGRDMPVTAVALDYRPGERIRRHRHPVNQLIYAVRGVMVVTSDVGQWLVPPTRALWMPASVVHGIRMIGHIRMRTVYVRPYAASGMPTACVVVAVSRLLSERVLEAVNVRLPYTQDSRGGRLLRLLLDEMVQVHVLPLTLPYPSDPRLKAIHQRITEAPDDPTTAVQWARTFQLNPRTLHRLFVRETSLTFGQWRRQARLLTALEMLAKGERIVDVALAVGYRSPTAFSTMFHRQFGAPPKSYFEATDFDRSAPS